MKLLKRLLTLIVAVLILTTTVSSYAYSGATLHYLGAIPEGVTDATVVTREYLAYSLSKMIIADAEQQSVETGFSDVASDDAYSGYIKLVSDRGIMTGGGDGTFRPKEPVGIDAVSKVLVSMLGYGAIAEAKGGWPMGYTTVASQLKLYKGVDTSVSPVTYKELKTMLVNSLSVKISGEQYYMENGELNMALELVSDNSSYAKKYFNLVGYEGIINDINLEKNTAKVTITEAERDYEYQIGKTLSLDIWEGLNVSAYKNLPVEFSVYDDRIIVDATVSSEITVKFGVVDSVNNNTGDASYSTRHINAITLMDDEKDYEISEDCVFVKNTEEFSGTINLLDKYVKIAAEDDEIVLIEAWDFTDINGIITDAGASYLNYRVGNDEKRLDKIADLSEKLVIIDGEIRTYKELKEGMVFSYWRDAKNDILVVAASEKTVTDTLSSYSTSDKSISVGNLTIGYADTLYFSMDGARYSKGISAISEYFDLDVTIRLNIYGDACYVTRYAGEVGSNKFMGYLLGTDEGQAFGKSKARIANVENSNVATKDYEMARVVTYGDGLDAAKIKASAGTKDGSALYEIELNAKGEVKGFYKLKEYEGFEGQTWSGIWGSFIDHYNPYLVVNGKKLFIAGQTPVLCIHDDDGEIEFYNIKYQSLVGKECNEKISLKFYGYENAPELKLVVMTGNINVVSGNRGRGVVERYGTALDESGDMVTYIRINDTNYIVKEGSASGIEEGMLVNYTVSLFEPDSIIVEEALDLMDFASMDGKVYGQMSYKHGCIERIDRLKITLEGSVDGSLCYCFEDVKFYGVDDDGELNILSYKDLDAGMEVVIGIETASNGGQSVKDVYVRKN